jgi:hypothetical protein
MLCAPLLDYDGGVKSKYVELCMMCGTLSNMCGTCVILVWNFVFNYVKLCLQLCEIVSHAELYTWFYSIMFHF